MNRTQPKFKVGDVVRIKEGVTDPDDSQSDWSGWHGRVIDISGLAQDTPVIVIELDSITLRSLSAEYIEQSEEQGLDWSQLYLFPEDVEPTAPRDTAREVQRVRDKLGALHGWAALGEEGKRIQAVLGEAVLEGDWKQMGVWADYLQRHLSFPFEAEVYESDRRGPLRVGDRLVVLAVEDVDDSYGVIMKCRRGRERYHFPLADMKAVDRKSPNYQAVDDFGVWFSNR